MMDSFKEELTVATVEPKNWKGIFIALLVIASICTVITGAILILNPQAVVGKERIRLDEVFSHRFKARIQNITWLSNREIVYEDADGSLMKHNISSKWNTILASNATIGKLRIDRFSVSNDGRYILLVHDVKKSTNYAYKARYKVYDTENSYMISITVPGLDNDYQIDYIEWGPIGSQLIVVISKDIILFPKFNSKPIFITNSGANGNIYNGVPDILYQEFIFRDNKALWWSEDGTKFCFLSFDNTAVDRMPILFYGSPYNLTETLTVTDPLSYPKIVNIPYPKPGRNNPIVNVRITILHGDSVEIKNIRAPDKFIGTQYYIKTVSWIGTDKISVVWSERTQNYSIVTLCDENSNWQCNMLHEEYLNAPNGWLDIKSSPLFTSNLEYYFMILPVADGASGTFDHIVMFTRNGNKRYHLTHGQFIVTKLYTHRADIHTLFYQATIETNPSIRHIFSITDTEHDNPRVINCLSCNLGPSCTHNEAKFSSDSEYYILECLGPGVPRTELRFVSTNELTEVLDTFPWFQEYLDSRAIPIIRYYTISLEENISGRVKLLLPPGLDENDSIKYPMIIKLNNEPEGQSISNINQLSWDHYLAGTRAYIVAFIDIRGSGYQGNAFKHSIQHKMGVIDSNDLVKVIRSLKERFNYVEEDKIALVGSEIGGYLVTSLMIQDSAFNCGIAISPVTSWSNYASFFMEKTMGLPWPQDNFMNYDRSDLFRRVSGLKDKALMVIHGTADSKVNIQHSMLLIKALTDSDVPVRVQLYPDAEHALHDEQIHLYKTLEDFFAKCFQTVNNLNDAEMELTITKVFKGGKKIITGEE